MDLLSFGSSIARTYLERYVNPPGLVTQEKHRARADEVRYDMGAHGVFPQNCRTHWDHCHMKSTIKYEKYDSGFHVKRFREYHTQ